MNSCKVYKIYVGVLYLVLMGIVAYSFFERKTIFQPYEIEIEHKLPQSDYDMLDSLRVQVKDLTKSINESTELNKQIKELEYGK